MLEMWTCPSTYRSPTVVTGLEGRSTLKVRIGAVGRGPGKLPQGVLVLGRGGKRRRGNSLGRSRLERNCPRRGRRVAEVGSESRRCPRDGDVWLNWHR